MNVHKNLKQARIGLELLRKEAGKIPAVAFLELLILQKEGSKKYADTILKYASAYPDYSMITLTWLNRIYISEDIPEEIENKIFDLDTLFPGRDSLHFLEMFYLLMLVIKQKRFPGWKTLFMVMAQE